MFEIALRAVIPVFIIIGIGYLCKKRNWVGETALKQFNFIAFRVFLPCQVVINVLEANIKGNISLPLLICVFGGVLLGFGIGFCLIAVVKTDPGKRGPIIQGCFRGNYLLLGIPIVSALFGADNAGAASFLIAIVIPLFNIFAVIALETFNLENRNNKAVLNTVKAIFKNPLIISSVVGLVIKGINFDLDNYYILSKTVRYFGAAATPLTLFILGGSFKPESIKDEVMPIASVLLVKLLLLPLIMITAGYVLKLSAVEIGIVLAVFSTPVAANSYVMTLQSNGDGRFAANLIVTSSVISCFTLVGWIVVLQMVHLI